MGKLKLQHGVITKQTIALPLGGKEFMLKIYSSCKILLIRIYHKVYKHKPLHLGFI